VTHSCMFMLCNIFRVWPFLTQKAVQVLLQHWLGSLLVPSYPCTLSRTPQPALGEPGNVEHVTPLLCTIHWLPVEARRHHKTRVVAYGAVKGTDLPYLRALLKPLQPQPEHSVLPPSVSWSSTLQGGLVPLSPVKALLCSGTPLTLGQQSPCPSSENIWSPTSSKSILNSTHSDVCMCVYTCIYSNTFDFAWLITVELRF
jgi:hypothetical protein